MHFRKHLYIIKGTLSHGYGTNCLLALSWVANGQPDTWLLELPECQSWLGLPEAGRLSSSGFVPATQLQLSGPGDDRKGKGSLEEALGSDVSAHTVINPRPPPGTVRALHTHSLPSHSMVVGGCSVVILQVWELNPDRFLVSTYPSCPEQQHFPFLSSSLPSTPFFPSWQKPHKEEKEQILGSNLCQLTQGRAFFQQKKFAKGRGHQEQGKTPQKLISSFPC